MVYKFPVKHDFFFQIGAVYLHNPNPYQKQLKKIIARLFGHCGDTQGGGKVYLSSLEDLVQILTAAAVIWTWAVLNPN